MYNMYTVNGIKNLNAYCIELLHFESINISQFVDNLKENQVEIFLIFAAFITFLAVVFTICRPVN